MNKKEQIKFLESIITEVVQLRLKLEAEVRIAASFAFQANDINDPNISKEEEIKNTLKFVDAKIHFLKEVRDEVEKDIFKVG